MTKHTLKAPQIDFRGVVSSEPVAFLCCTREGWFWISAQTHNDTGKADPGSEAAYIFLSAGFMWLIMCIDFQMDSKAPRWSTADT